MTISSKGVSRVLIQLAIARHNAQSQKQGDGINLLAQIPDALQS